MKYSLGMVLALSMTFSHAVLGSEGMARTGGGLNLDIVSMLLSLLLVIATIVVLAVIVKRFNPNLASSSDFKVIRSLPLGTKERLLVVEIDNKQHLLGVTPQSINYLYELKEPLAEREITPMAKQFAHLLNTNKKN